VRVDQCVSAIRAVEVPVLSAYVTAAVTSLRRGAERLVRLALMVVMQNDGDFVDVILLYTSFGKCTL
jgi:RNase P/RNase MRP subunit POP5